MISTTARLLFRIANPEYKKQRNGIVNNIIANMFSKAQIEDKNFRPKAGGNAIGEFRTLSSMRFVAIVDQSSIRILSVKGTMARVPAPVETANTMPKTSALKKIAGFEPFIHSHLSNHAKKMLKLSDDDYQKLEDYLLPMYSNDKSKMLKSISKAENHKAITDLLYQHILKDEKNKYLGTGGGRSDAFAINSPYNY